MQYKYIHTMPELDKTFFTRIHVPNFKYDFYTPVGNPMVLKSTVTGRCLFSLHTFYADETTNVQNCPTFVELDRPIDETFNQQFQLVFPSAPLDDRVSVGNGRKMMFVITNLCHEGYVKLDIMRDSEKVLETDPGGINQVNEIRPFESTAINADQTNDDKQLMIKIKTTDEGNTVTLENELKTDSVKKIGDYLWITVTPRTGIKEFTEIFADTMWTVPEYIIVDKKHTQHASNSNASMSNNVLMGSGGGSRGLGTLERFDECDCADEISLPKHASAGTLSIIHDECERYALPARKKSIAHSKVAGFAHGDKVAVYSGVTNVTYDYTLSSPRCMIGMSVLENVVIEQIKQMSVTEAIDILKSHELSLNELNDKKLLLALKEIKTFKSDECVICMEDKPNILFLKCGHICTCSGNCSDNLSKCPICRNVILSKIDSALIHQ
jgi:hypothetical protein